jgi:hypothetical protein
MSGVAGNTGLSKGVGDRKARLGIGAQSRQDVRLHELPLGRKDEIDRGRIAELAGELAKQLRASSGLSKGADGTSEIVDRLSLLKDCDSPVLIIARRSRWIYLLLRMSLNRL